MRDDDIQEDVEQPDVPGGERRHQALADAAGERPAVDGVVVVIGEQPQHALRGDKAQHRQHGEAAERVVAEKAARPAQQEIPGVAQRRPRPVQERGKARRRAAGKTPQDAEHDQDEDGVAVPLVPGEVIAVFAREVRAEDQQRQQPMEQPRRQVPGLYTRFSQLAVSSLVPHHGHSSLTVSRVSGVRPGSPLPSGEG